MSYSNKISFNFSGGEVSPGLIPRTDIPLFNKVLSRMDNWVAEPQGASRFRNGTVYVHHTRLNQYAVFIEFQFSDVQSYIVELTDQYMRFYKDNALILNSTTKAITGITKASPGVVTAVAHGYATGDEIYHTGIVGMTELNGMYAVIAKVDADHYQLKDVFGNSIDTSGFTTYSSGGTAANVYEIKTPYLEADLAELTYSQNADVMYIASQKYAQRKLTRILHDSWTVLRYTRTADPFNALYALTAITQANPGVVTAVAHTFSTGQQIRIDSVVGMIEVNDRWYTVVVIDADHYSLKTLAGVAVNTTGYTAYVSGGTVEFYNAPGNPAAVSFTDDARLVFAGTRSYPETIWFSRGPSAAGAVRYDDFTTGTDATHAVYFTLAPLRGKVDSIRWITNTDKYIAMGTFGSVRRIFGDTEASPVTPTAITAKSANADGVAIANPVVDGPVLFYIDRSSRMLNSLLYSYQIDGYEPDDQNLVSDHLTYPGFVHTCRQLARPTVIWVVRADGVLLGMTYKTKENIAGWHQHHIGGSGYVDWSATMPRDSEQDQLWLPVKRTINTHTVRYVEYIADPPQFPVREDFFELADDEDGDTALFLNAQWEARKNAIHVDSAVTYDGSVYGSDAGATLTVGANANVDGTTGVTFTASAAVFTAAMVGRQLWGKYDTQGAGGGRATITGFTNSTHVVVTITEPFPALEVFAAGDWFLTATALTGLKHLEGQTVSVIGDGDQLADVTVTNGAATIDTASSVVHIGFPYKGIMKTLSLEQGGNSGPAQDKVKNIAKVDIRFRDSAETKFGTDLYNLTTIAPDVPDVVDRPNPLGSGIAEQIFDDKWERDKFLYIVQDVPYPCVINAIDVYANVADDGG